MRRSSTRNKTIQLAAIAAAAVVGSSAAWAGNQTWVGTTGTWGTDSNWTGDGGAVQPTATDVAVFGDLTSPNTGTLTAGAGIAGSLTFNSTTTAYSIATAVQIATGGSISISSSNTQAITFTTAPQFGIGTATGNGSIINNGTGAVTIAAPGAVAAGVLNVGGSGNITLTAPPGSGAGQQLIWTATPTGTQTNPTLTMTAAMTNYQGGMTFNGGTVILNNQNSVPPRLTNLNNATMMMTSTNASTQLLGLSVTGSSLLLFANTATNQQWQIGNTTGTGTLTSASTASSLSVNTTLATGGLITNYLVLTPYAGTIDILNNTTFRIRSVAGVGSASAKFNLGGAGSPNLEMLTPIAAQASAAITETNLGSVAGNSATAVLRGATNGATGTPGIQFAIGGNGLSTTYAGRIMEGLATGTSQTTGAPGIGQQGFTAIRKVGAGTLTLTGTTNTYKGGTILSAGTLAITSDGALGAAYDGSVIAFTYTGNSSTSGTASVSITGGGGSGAAGTAFGLTNFYFDIPSASAGTGYYYDPTVTISGLTPTPLATARVKGLLTFDGGTLRTDAAMSSNRAIVITANGGTVNTNGFDSTFSGRISNGAGSTGGFQKTGLGKLTLSGTSTYAGTTTVAAGTLALTGTFVMTGTSVLQNNIAADATNGRLDAGTNAVDGALTVNLASVFEVASWDLVDTASGTVDGFDTITLTGSYVGSLTESVAGMWTGTVGAQDWTFDESTGVLAVPEPTSLALLGLVGGGLLARRRRQM